MTNYFIQNLKT